MKLKSALITQASGSIGGLTASRNRGGMYFRARATPTNPNTPQQQQVRSLMAALTSRWVGTLTAAQRDAWNQYALQVPLTDSLGEPRNVGGLGMYVRTNVPRMQVLGVPLDAAPTIFDLGTFSPLNILTATASADTVEVTFDDADEWADTAGGLAIVYTSRPQNSSVNYFKGPFRLADALVGDPAPPSSPASVGAAFTFAAGQVIFTRIRILQPDGRLSLPQDFRTVAT